MNKAVLASPSKVAVTPATWALELNGGRGAASATLRFEPQARSLETRLVVSTEHRFERSFAYQSYGSMENLG
jgi:hypothetical protein